MFAVSDAEILVGIAGEFGDELRERRTAYSESALVVSGKSMGGKKAGRDGSVTYRERLEEFGDKAEFFQFFCGGGDSVGELDEGTHQSAASMAEFQCSKTGNVARLAAGNGWATLVL